MKRGFTLIELLLYISIVSVMLTVVTLSFISISESRNKGRSVSDVYSEGNLISKIIKDAIMEADSITLPVSGNSSSTLELSFSNPSLNPTIFSLNGINIEMSEGGNGPYVLNTSNIEITSISFKNLTSSGEAGSIHFEFDLAHVNPEGRNEFEYNAHFEGGAVIRKSP